MSDRVRDAEHTKRDVGEWPGLPEAGAPVKRPLWDLKAIIAA
jgi:hypothetical protein